MAWPLLPKDGQFKYANLKLFEYCSNWSLGYPLFAEEQNNLTYKKKKKTQLTIKSIILSLTELPKLPTGSPDREHFTRKLMTSN